MTAPGTPVSYAGPEHTGSICPICQEAISAHQLIQMCEVCGLPVHRRCWESGRGCSRLECPGGSVAASVEPGRPPQIQAQVGIPAPAVGAGPVPREPAGSSVALLLFAAIIPVIGPMFGIVFGFLWLDPARTPAKRRDGRILLIFSIVMFIISLISVAVNFAAFLEVLQGGGSPIFTQIH